MKFLFKFFFILLIVMYMTNTGNSQSLNRDQVDTKDKWKLEDIYPTDDAWREAKKEVSERAEKLTS